MTTYNKDQEYTLKVANTDNEVKVIKYTPDKDMSKPELITALKSKYKNFFKLIESKNGLDNLSIIKELNRLTKEYNPYGDKTKAESIKNEVKEILQNAPDGTEMYRVTQETSSGWTSHGSYSDTYTVINSLKKENGIWKMYGRNRDDLDDAVSSILYNSGELMTKEEAEKEKEKQKVNDTSSHRDIVNIGTDSAGNPVGKSTNRIDYPNKKEEADKLIGSKGMNIKMEETKVAENQKVTISVKALFDKFGTVLSNNNEIIAKDDYYDLINEDGVLVCADGEECLVQSVTDNTVTLVNFSGEKDVTFTLDLAEFKIATDITGLEEAKEDNSVIVVNYGMGTRFPNRQLAIDYYTECVAGVDPNGAEYYTYISILSELKNTDKDIVYDVTDKSEYDYWVVRGKPVEDISTEQLNAHIPEVEKQEEDIDNNTVNSFVGKSLTELFSQFDLDGIDVSDKDCDMLVYIARIDEPDTSDSYEVYIHNLCNKLKVTSNFTEGDDIAIVDLTTYVKENKEAFLDIFKLNATEDDDVIGDIVTKVMPNLIAGYATESIYKQLLKTVKEDK